MAIGTQSYPPITLEDYLLYYHIAYKRQNIKAQFQLDDRYPELLKLAIDDEYMSKKEDPADGEWLYTHPIVIDSTRMTELRVLDMVAYLYCQNKAPEQFVDILKNEIVYHTVFNYDTDRYQRDYDKEALWNDFFNGVPELCQRIRKRRIRSLSELEYRATEYFESTCTYRRHSRFFKYQ